MTDSEPFIKLKTELRDTLARRVRELRLHAKMSQRELAEDADMRQALISRIERGEANPTLDSIAKIAVALDVRLTDHFG
ncbi:multiprotein-bridging factor 1 family protein [Bradyrhizobium erythrophlei]|uniref:helix-turn-helix domain-containing protein n=1 Tax=Bradyrhizobium erythrophlei TaxID=1437360 RepID=UPI0035E9DCC2